MKATHMRISTQCPKCQNAMEQGFVLDRTHGALIVSEWAAGHPQKSWFMVTHMPDGGAVPIGTFRCTSCGYLEQYARQEFAAE